MLQQLERALPLPVQQLQQMPLRPLQCKQLHLLQLPQQQQPGQGP